MEELQEFTIYRGYNATLDASIAELGIEPSEISALIYSKSLGKKFLATTVTSEIVANNVQFVWGASLTALMDAGKYDIEFYNGEELYDVRKNFVTVMKASPADGEIISVQDTSESSAS